MEVIQRMLIYLLLFALAGCLFIWIGSNILKKERTPFIAGYNTVFHPKNERVLARRVGVVVILFGVETKLFPPVAFFFNVEGFYFGILAGVDIVVVFILLIVDQLEV